MRHWLSCFCRGGQTIARAAPVAPPPSAPLNHPPKDRIMKKTLLITAALAALAGNNAHAEAASEGPELSLNAAVVSDYRYRAISQSRLQPALQGGLDVVDNQHGWYAGAWASTIKWTGDAGGAGELEADLYGGKRGQLTQALAYDVGLLGYLYPANQLDRVAGMVNANTAEAYAQLGYGPLSLKYSLALTNLFGFAGSRRSGYLELGASLDAGAALTVNLHAGHQQVRQNGLASYSDWKIGLSKDFGVATGALALLGSNASKTAYASPANGKFLGRTALQLSISKAF